MNKPNVVFIMGVRQIAQISITRPNNPEEGRDSRTSPNLVQCVVRPFIIVSFLLCTSMVSFTQPLNPVNNKSKLVSSIDSILRSQVVSDLIPGAVIQLKQGRRILYRQAYGFAKKYDNHHQLLARPEKMKPCHLFDLASLTKVLATTSAIMILVDRGAIHLNDPVSKYLSGFDFPGKKDITIRHLLTHTSGMTEWYPTYYRSDNKQQTYKFIEELPLKYPVGEKRHYSDLGFVLLGAIVEQITGIPFDQFLHRNLFKPLHMYKTGFNPLKNIRKRKIAATSHGNPYEKRMVHDSTLGFNIKEIDPEQWNGWRTHTLRGEVNDGNTWYANDGISGAAGLFSTVRDIQKLLDLLLDKSKYPGIISKKTIATFLTKDQYNNGLGWIMDTSNSIIKNGPDGSFGHTGFTGTSIAVIPQFGISVILLINRQNTGLSSAGEYYNVNPVRQQVFTAILKYCQ